jgi:hypothetical protein
MTTQAQNPPPGTPSRWLRRLCWALAVLGAAAPWYFNLRYFATGGSVAPGVFFADASANALTTAIAIDVYLAAVAFSIWVAADRALGAWRWAYVGACFGIGLSFALPLYLAQRLRTSP